MHAREHLLLALAPQTIGRVSTGKGKVREICFSFKVREKSGNSIKWSGKLEIILKSGKSQGILISSCSDFVTRHPASFAHNFVSGMQSFYFSGTQDAIALQT